MMEEQEIIGRIQRLGEIASREEAVHLVKAAAETLSERLPLDEVHRVAAALPANIGSLFPENSAPAESFAAREFVRRVSLRTGVPEDLTIRRLRAAAQAMQEAIPAEVANKVLQQLPGDIRQFFYAGPGPAAR